MTIPEFERAAIALLRSAIGWQTAIARRLDVAPRTVRRWLAAGAVPDWAEQRLAELAGLTDAAGRWPRDEWLVGTDPSGRRQYVCHLVPPRFVARVVDADPAGRPLGERADTVTGTVYVADGSCLDDEDAPHQVLLCEVVWIDSAPVGQTVSLMEAASDALEAWESGA